MAEAIAAGTRTSAEGSSTVLVAKSELVLGVTCATLFGVVPYVLLAERPWLLFVVALVTPLLAWRALRSARTRTTARPSEMEYLLGVVAALALTGATGFIGLTFYGLTWVVLHGVGWLAGRMSWELSLAIPSISWWVSLVMVSFVLLFNTGDVATSLAKQLYPETAGMRSAFYSVSRNHPVKASIRLLAIAVILIAVLVLVRVAPAMTVTWWFALLLTYSMMVVAIPLQNLGEQSGGQPEKLIEGIRALFETAGYRVVRSPRTGREDIDPLLLNSPDLYVEGYGRSYAVEVPPTSIADGHEFQYLDGVLSAVWALNKYFKETSGSEAVEAEPVVVCFGEPSPAIRIYEQQALIRVLRIPSEEQLRVLQKTFQKSTDQDARRALAQQQLQDLHADLSTAVPTP